MKIHFNSPVVLTYTIVCCAVLGISTFPGMGIMPYFTVYPSMDVSNPIDYFRLFSHVIGHSNWPHLFGNFTYILLLGPILEEKYGSKPLLLMIFVTAIITGLLNVLLFSTGLLGASGIVFMMILLSSVVNYKKGHVPLTFILVVMLFLGQEVFNAFKEDQISQFGHIIGGVIGALFGFGFQRNA